MKGKKETKKANQTVKILPRGYFEFTANGKKISGQINMYALQMYSDKMGFKSISELFENLNGNVSIKSIALMLLCGVESACNKSGKEFLFKEADSYEWLDEITILEASRIISRALSGAAGAEDNTTNDEKKSL